MGRRNRTLMGMLVLSEAAECISDLVRASEQMKLNKWETEARVNDPDRCYLDGLHGRCVLFPKKEPEAAKRRKRKA